MFNDIAYNGLCSTELLALERLVISVYAGGSTVYGMNISMVEYGAC